jgi:uncharacterized protein with GYD domain
MAKYLIQAGYTAAGAKGLLKEGGTGRRKAVEKVLDSLGGSLEAMYFAYGDYDLVLIVDFPDEVSMAAASLAVKASGALDTKATVLLTVEQVDEAVRRPVTFRPPGA